MSKTWGFFLVVQDMILSHRAKFQLIINFFWVKAISTELKVKTLKKLCIAKIYKVCLKSIPTQIVRICKHLFARCRLH